MASIANLPRPLARSLLPPFQSQLRTTPVEMGMRRDVPHERRCKATISQRVERYATAFLAIWGHVTYISGCAGSHTEKTEKLVKHEQISKKAANLSRFFFFISTNSDRAQNGDV